jgi:hypothetical protein
LDAFSSHNNTDIFQVLFILVSLKDLVQVFFNTVKAFGQCVVWTAALFFKPVLQKTICDYFTSADILKKYVPIYKYRTYGSLKSSKSCSGTGMLMLGMKINIKSFIQLLAISIRYVP